MSCVELLGEDLVLQMVAGFDSLLTAKINSFLQEMSDSTTIITELATPEFAKNMLTKPQYGIRIVPREEADEILWQGKEK